MVFLQESKESQAIQDTVRWAFYDLHRGVQTADPAHSGICPEILAKLESVLDAPTIVRLKREGVGWAKYQLDAQKEVTWEEAKPHIPCESS
jgi:hypothetical protein